MLLSIVASSLFCHFLLGTPRVCWKENRCYYVIPSIFTVSGCTVGGIVESRSVEFKSVLETPVSTVYTVPNTTTSESLQSELTACVASYFSMCNVMLSLIEEPCVLNCWGGQSFVGGLPNGYNLSFIFVLYDFHKTCKKLCTDGGVLIKKQARFWQFRLLIVHVCFFQKLMPKRNWCQKEPKKAISLL